MLVKNEMLSAISTTLILVFMPSLLILLVNCNEVGLNLNTPIYSRHDFPPHFVFGAGTSAYQVEGAAAEDGRTPSIWDTIAHTEISTGTGDKACDQYHKYKEDVQLMTETGLDAYRFSISWSRLIPNGRGPVNPQGLQYYNNLINELISHGIEPHVTLFHYDLPQALEDEYGGWLSRKILKDFTAYADVCFREFGDRVAHWTTINEANIFALGGYGNGTVPPKRCSAPFGVDCIGGNSTIEPYVVAHNILLAHASVARLYKRKYQISQHGLIGFNVFSYWFIPFTNKTEDVIATQRANDFLVGWFIGPLVFGTYPDIMKKIVGSRLPTLTRYESNQVKGSYDFIGVNHYETVYVKEDLDSLKNNIRDPAADTAAHMIFKRDGVPDGELPINAAGMQGLLEYFKTNYGNPPIYIHENGQKTSRNISLNDTSRVNYLDAYIGSLLNALRNESAVRGYFVWSFLDVYELLGGYNTSYGIYYVDFEDPELKRYARLSAKWYSNFLKGDHVNNDGVIGLETL
ncbi:hypothetical protein AQUCO_00300733v1 [Aquilegia coerulea]|uniref:Beta-glucosidase n=2 Tax=Aquilegia coerulea TaxID=218851 RepID=A0A2G5F054_AQUCA|nr:hypothetical protein AQUCO_00300733v1 [Aquilegia coerulea]